MKSNLQKQEKQYASMSPDTVKVAKRIAVFLSMDYGNIHMMED